MHDINWQSTLAILMVFICFWNILLFVWRDETLRVFGGVILIGTVCFQIWPAAIVFGASAAWAVLSSMEFNTGTPVVNKFKTGFEITLPTIRFDVEKAVVQAITSCHWTYDIVVNQSTTACTEHYNHFGGGLKLTRSVYDKVDISWKQDGRVLLFDIAVYEPTGYRFDMTSYHDKQVALKFQQHLQATVDRMLTSKTT